MSKKITEMDLPRDLKKMDIHGLELMAVAIREFLIDSVSATGGHLASNLGIVEISLGLHKVFDSPGPGGSARLPGRGLRPVRGRPH